MASEVALDVLEHILILLDVEDLIHCKSVCKSWLSLISTPRFLKAHLKLAYANDCNNPELGHRRICHPGIRQFYLNLTHIVGSCNGLLCISPKNVTFIVTNPLTREHRQLSALPYGPYTKRKLINIREALCWGFGYDSSTDDYKVIAGFEKKEWTIYFHALTLKSNTWKFIRQVKYEMKFEGILCGGALHWVMSDTNKKTLLISLDLSTEEFKEISLADTDVSDIHDYVPGVIEECLCVESRCRYSRCNPLHTKKWVMKNNKWELYTDDHCQSKYDIAHSLTTTCICDDGSRVPSNGDYVRASIFIKSLVSPHPHVKQQQGHKGNERVESGAKGNFGKRKMRKGSCNLK